MKLIAIALSTLLTTGCASILGSTKQLVSINSTPAGASVVVKDEAGAQVFTGTTPATVTLEKHKGYFSGKDYSFTFEKAGYHGQVVTLTSETSNWYLWGNLLVGGIIGWFIVDPLTGAMWKYEPESVSVVLASAATAEAAAARP